MLLVTIVSMFYWIDIVILFSLYEKVLVEEFLCHSLSSHICFASSVHGLVRGENMELGRDSDTGGQVIVYEHVYGELQH